MVGRSINHDSLTASAILLARLYLPRLFTLVCILLNAMPATALEAEPSLSDRVNQLERELNDIKTQVAPPPAAALPPQAAPTDEDLTIPQAPDGGVLQPTAPLPPPEDLVVRTIPPRESTTPAVSVATPPAEKRLNPAQTWTGLGPSASKVYFNRDQELVFGLSSEFFTFKQQKGLTGSTPNVNRTNVLSLAPALGIRLDKKLLFNSQILFENGGSESSDSVGLQKGQAIVRMAYVEWFPKGDASGIRLGHQLIPIGVVNTSADPTTYFGVLRPELERELIPSSWHENGLSAWLTRAGMDFEGGIFSSLNSAGFRQDTFLAGGRSQGQNSASDDLMAAIRANVRSGNFSFGASGVLGNSAQGNNSIRAGSFQLGEVHGGVNFTRFQISAMLAHGELQDAESISIVNLTTVSETAKGYSAEMALEILGDSQKLWLFARYSHYNLADKVPAGSTADPALNKTVTTTGVSYFPLANIVIKADYAAKRSGAGNDEDEFNLGAGFVF